MLSKKVRLHELPDHHPAHRLPHRGRYLDKAIPKYELPAESMPADVAYRLIRDELNLDANPALNLASFVTTWMEPEAERLIVETLNKNYVNQEEYPQTTELQTRCVNMLARLFGASSEHASAGTSTVGSSEAIHLAGLAMKWRWRKRRTAQGKPADKPNLVMGANVQVCWEKFARYFDVEARYVPCTTDRYILGVEEAIALCDENTIGVAAILGSTYTGQYEPVAELDEAVTALNARTGWEIPIHVDAASGGFVAPFLQPDLRWDFRLANVRSINVSGHKYGLVYPGVGWVVWRDAVDLPEELIFHVEYLGGDQPTFNLNFSKGAGQVIAQYYNFIRLGHAGYKRVMESAKCNAAHLSAAIEATGRFQILSDLERGLPLVCFRLRDERRFTIFDLSERLRERGWIVPAYHLAPNADHIGVARVVVREGFSYDMAEMLAEDIRRALDRLDHAPQPHPEGHAAHHGHHAAKKGKRHKLC
jgi:glutamate decarboxylase